MGLQMKALKKCAPNSHSPEFFDYCIDMQAIVEANRPNVKGIVEIVQPDASPKRNFVVAKQGDYRYKGLAFNYCPFCGEAVRLIPQGLPAQKT